MSNVVFFEMLDCGGNGKTSIIHFEVQMDSISLLLIREETISIGNKTWNITQQVIYVSRLFQFQVWPNKFLTGFMTWYLPLDEFLRTKNHSLAFIHSQRVN